MSERPLSSAALPSRHCVRALILSPERSVLLIRMELPHRELWMTPGGGIASGESHEVALRRELAEEVGRDDLVIGPLIWVREGTFVWAGTPRAEREHFYLVRAEEFVADASRNPIAHEREAMVEFRWWSATDLPEHSTSFAPARIGPLVRDLLHRGVPAIPVSTGA
jgi:8-oxo-dGTP pyrophosphatase MutT (NUDIX family)